jgi:hypothetical protein
MDTPILLIHFNRPASTAKQLQLLATVKPSRLWVVCDGARSEKPDEAALVAQVRELLQNIPWPCEVKYCFRDTNLGVCANISSAITWFLSEAEAGIILEDDVQPSDSFFSFMELVLQQHADDANVMCVSGFTGRDTDYPMPASYGFSNYFSCWGWGTWRRAWELYDAEMEAFTNDIKWQQLCRRVLPSMRQRLYWNMIFRRVLQKTCDSWAYRFQLSIWASRGLAVTPCSNLVVNTGFGSDATNTSGLQHFHAAPAEMQFPLVIPASIEANKSIDRWIEDHWHSKSLPVRIKWLFSKIRR